jgi:putative SOS response-associated peptidase YedK
MCGRYSNKYDGRKLIVRYQAANRNFEHRPNSNVAPTQLSPVVCMENGVPRLKEMKWGLIPSWAKDSKIGVKCFNARGETVEEKPAFRSSFKSRRCLVPADAFYEWREELEMRRVGREERKNSKIDAEEVPTGRKYKQPYKFTVKGLEIFSLAGLWSSWVSPAGDPIESFTVITTEPNDLMAQYHNRMPVILPLEKEQVWLNPEFTNPVLLKGLLRPFPSQSMAVEIIDRL